MTRDRLARQAVLINFLVVLALAWPIQALAAGGQWAEGRLRLAHGEDFRGHAYYDYELATDQGTYRLDFGGEGPAGFLNGASVRVHGYPKADHVLAVGNNSADAQVVAPTQVVAAASTKKVALILVNFLTNTAQPWTTAQAYDVVFGAPGSVANYFGEESYGQATVTGDVLGYYTIDYDTTTCNYSDIAAKAKSAATADGKVLSNYTNYEYAFPNLSSCGWAGLAYVPGTETWLNNALTLRVSGHELSHNFGVHHASTISCSESGVRVALSANLANCTYSEYGDPFSIMGSASTRHTHNQQLVQMGWISTSQTPTVTVSGTYSLGASEDTSSVPKALRVARGNGTYLYLEAREPWGSYFDNFSASDPAVTGVTLRISNDWTTIIQSKLIDTTPATSSYLDAPLAVGASFTDPVTGVTITTVSDSGGVASVNISWGPDTLPPSAPTNLSAGSTGATTATVSWSASTDNVGVAGYEVSRDGLVLGTTSATSWPDSGLAGGQTYAYAVRAFDAAGNWSGAATRSWTQPTPDTTKPTAPGNLTYTAFSKTKITLAWTASTDNVAVAGYRVYRNGVLWATVSGTTTSYTGNRQNKVYTYTVVAFDAAGNFSPASNSLTK
jgi:chitodextrinase